MAETLDIHTALEDAVYQFHFRQKTLRVFDIGGQWRFAVYGANGAICDQCVVYVFRPRLSPERGYDVVPVRLLGTPRPELLVAALKEAEEKFESLRSFVPEGGVLPLAEGLDYRKK